jgi:cytidylate kinase
MGVITISRQLGAGETSIAPAVAEALGWQCIDHNLLDRAVEETGAPLPRVTHFDERAPGNLEAWSHPHEAEGYFSALARIVLAYYEAGNVIIVGRGAGFILRGKDILSVRLFAEMHYRIQRVMEVRWASEAHAKEILRQNDHDRVAFHRKYFQADWEAPVNYDLLLNVSSLGIDLAAGILVGCAKVRWPG